MGADVSAVDANGMTMIEFAAYRGFDLDALSLLSTSLTDGVATKALWSALESKVRARLGVDEVDHFIGLGADVFSLNSRGLTMHQYAMTRDYDGAVLELLSGVGVEPTPAPVVVAATPTATPTHTPVPTAIPVPTLTPRQATQSLWDALGRSNAPPTPLEVDDLISLGADISALNSDGQSMLDFALSRAVSFEVVKLLSTNSSAEAATRALWSVLTRHWSLASYEEVSHFIELGADLGARDSDNQTMHEYAEERNYESRILGLLSVPEIESTPVPVVVAPEGWSLRSESGTISTRHSDGYIGCPRSVDDPAFIGSDALSGAVEFDFIVPNVANWSIGIVYHQSASNSYSMTFVYWDGTSLRARHGTLEDGVLESTEGPHRVVSGIVDPMPGDPVRFEFETDQTGSRLKLESVEVLDVQPRKLRPTSGQFEVCVGVFSREQLEYAIRYKRLRAWTYSGQ